MGTAVKSGEGQSSDSGVLHFLLDAASVVSVRKRLIYKLKMYTYEIQPIDTVCV